MNTYVLITLLVISGPLALSFDKRVAFFRQWKRLIVAIIPVSAIYLLWDVLVTERGHWSFKPEYAGSWQPLGLPAGEWLFFFVVPYACLFILEVVRAYFPRKRFTNIKLVRTLAVGAIILLLGGSYLWRDQAYTVLALLAAAAWVALTVSMRIELLTDSHLYLFFGLSIMAFFVVNGVLTGLPVVRYNPQAIWGIRIITIPLEDLFYNISMLGFYALSYETVPRWFSRKERT